MTESAILLPRTESELCDIVASAAANTRLLAIRGGGSKDSIGADAPDAAPLDMTGFSGITDYDPAELVMTAGAGTPLTEILKAVAERNQMLAFEPFDHAPLFGRQPGHATIGGIIAAGVSGSRRVSAGAARDHLLGFRAVSGRGESFVAGARVVKNVTGYDLCKLAVGSWGRLFAMTEVTLKVMPAPPLTQSLAIAGLDPQSAIHAMAAAMGSTAAVAAAAHLPTLPGGGEPATVLRLEGFAASVKARGALLASALSDFGTVRPLEEEEANLFWRGITNGLSTRQDKPLWRISVPPSAGATIISALADQAKDWAFDWAGGLIWLASGVDPGTVRRVSADAGGHAMLLRAPPEMRQLVPALHPQHARITALETRLRRAFDPAGVFETGRFGGAGDEN
ncbi:MAG: glycolate oxidase subunit GlcE [Sphingobium sp.]